MFCSKTAASPPLTSPHKHRDIPLNFPSGPAAPIPVYWPPSQFNEWSSVWEWTIMKMECHSILASPEVPPDGRERNGWPKTPIDRPMKECSAPLFTNISYGRSRCFMYWGWVIGCSRYIQRLVLHQPARTSPLRWWWRWKLSLFLAFSQD